METKISDCPYNAVIVLGATATGKTATGVQIALTYNGEILSADSRQIYIGLDICSGKDLAEYSAGGAQIPYHLIDKADVRTEEYNVFRYQQDFYRVFRDVSARGKLPVIVGGTGLYLDAVVRNYDFVEVPENPALRAELKEKPLTELGAMLLALKPDLHNKSDLLIRERVVRAIEIAVCMQNGEAKKLQSAMIARPSIRPLILGIRLERSALRENIAARLKARLASGMIEEIAGLHESGCSWETLEKLGLECKYCARYLEGKIASKEALFEGLNIAIRQFAKRQETWFKRMERHGVAIHWLPPTTDNRQRTNAALYEVSKYFG